ncbi:MAG: hypothetical protein ACKO83_06265 [Roseiflexaceae bacterium]
MTITAIAVNHNTSAYMELMLRSYDRMHAPDAVTQWALYDNASSDDTTALLDYARTRGTPLMQSGYGIKSAFNSHGHVLRQGVQAYPDSTYYVLLDADVVFTQPDTIPRLVSVLATHADAWAVGVCPSWDGVHEIPRDARDDNPDICDARLHPCCAVLRNTPQLQQLVAQIGFHTYVQHWPARDEYLDTCKLLTRVMQTHHMRHIVSDTIMVKHFYCT